MYRAVGAILTLAVTITACGGSSASDADEVVAGASQTPDAQAQPSVSTTTTAAPTTTQATTTTAASSGLSLAGLDFATVSERIPAAVAAAGYRAECAESVVFATDADDSFLEPGEVRYLGQSEAAWDEDQPCNVFFWTVESPTGELQWFLADTRDGGSVSQDSVERLIAVAIGLITTVDPDVDIETATTYLKDMGWLTAPEPTTFDGSTIVGDLRLRVFPSMWRSQARLNFEMTPAG